VPTLRISGIDAEFIEDFIQYIKDLSHGHENRVRWSLAPALSAGNSSYVATVSFDEIPDPFRSCVSADGDTTLPIIFGRKEVQVEVNVDTHFKGLTPLNETKKTPTVEYVEDTISASLNPIATY
jgi:hypothetical protein